MMQCQRQANPDITLTSDASGPWGCGAYWNTLWFQYQWSEHTFSYGITTKELLPIVLAAGIWGHAWKGKSILCHCDTEAVVTIINSGTSKEPESMALLRCLFFIAARNNLLITAVHLPGSSNQIADALSRNNLQFFSTIFPQANSQPSVIPPALTDLLVLSKPDWTSQSWNKMFNTIFNQPCQKTQ